jgi:hypothetical protein
LGSNEERQTLLKRLTPLSIKSSIRYASDGGSLYTFVKPQIVVEVKLTDLQSEHSDATTAKTMQLKYDKEEYKPIGMQSCPRPIHPVLERVREDKVVNETDVRIGQISTYYVEELDEASPINLPKSELIRREVWTKNTKDILAVRKLTVWKTNKSKVDERYPEYVIHWTDYSPGRASPLDREVKLAPDEKTAIRTADAMIEQNIKKGWGKIC